MGMRLTQNCLGWQTGNSMVWPHNSKMVGSSLIGPPGSVFGVIRELHSLIFWQIYGKRILQGVLVVTTLSISRLCKRTEYTNHSTAFNCHSPTYYSLVKQTQRLDPSRCRRALISPTILLLVHEERNQCPALS